MMWRRIPEPLSDVGFSPARAEWVDLSVFGALVVVQSSPALRSSRHWRPWCVIGVRSGIDAREGLPNAVLAYAEQPAELEELVERWLEGSGAG